MEASALKPVTDSKDKGESFLPSAGETSGWVAKGTVGAGPAPTAAINSGTKLAFPATKFTPADAGCGSHYPDPSSDEKVA